MDIQYHALRILFEEKLFYAPIDKNPQCILDIGTGTGESLLQAVGVPLTERVPQVYGLWTLVSMKSPLATRGTGAELNYQVMNTLVLKVRALSIQQYCI